MALGEEGDSPVAVIEQVDPPEDIESSAQAETEDFDTEELIKLAERLGDTEFLEANRPEPKPPEPSKQADPEDEGEDGKPASPTAIEDWVARFRANPRSQFEIPGKIRNDVIAQALTLERAEVNRAKNEAYAAGQQQARETAKAELQLESDAAALDTAKKEDPEGFLEWAEEHPEDYQAYVQYKKRGHTAPLAQAKADAAEAATAAILAQAQAMLSELPDEAIARLRARGTFNADAAGLVKLTQAVEAERLIVARASPVAKAQAAFAAKPRIEALAGQTEPSVVTREWLDRIDPRELVRRMDADPSLEARIDALHAGR